LQIFCKKITNAVTIEVEIVDITKVAENRENLFKTWLDRHKNLIFKVVNTYAASSEDKDDLFQDILLQLWSSIPGFQGNAKETTWIYRVALNTALVWKRKIDAKKPFKTEILETRQVSFTKDNCGELSQNNQVLKQVYDAVRQLPKSESSVVLLYLDGLSYDEMADILGISKNNVGVRLNRARKNLAQLLKGLIDDF
jgi:RNA polymerase sigma-70 factor (ECF subfamily)